ncbi:hypothetical protein HPB51_005536 [Rhipicephalus microplus]|uniref:Uncharacterized protein n=1 Tax=Rhipicephalus microplus TaxID=6941 RepID=A0A9J6EY06_RHIMP|nr:hypothetical protein HPB51_005536 [Rhipicephalus microplus]
MMMMMTHRGDEIARERRMMVIMIMQAQKKRRKTSFSSPERTSEGAVWACRLPTRTIRSFSSQSVQPSSILKGSSSKGKEPEYSTPPECRTVTTTKTCRPKVMTPKSPQQPGSRASVHAVELGDDGGSKTPSNESSNESKHEPAVKASVKLSDKPVVHSLVTQQTTSGPVDDMLRGSCHPVEAAPAEDVTSSSPVEESLEQQQQRQSPSALTTSTTPFSASSRSSAWSTPPATILDVWYTTPVTKSGERSVDSYAEWASQLMRGPNSWLLLPDGEDTVATSSFARSNESTTMKTAAEDQPQLSPSTLVVRESARSVVKWDTAPSKEEVEQSGWKLLQLIQGVHARTASEVCQLQEDAASLVNSSSERFFEDCGVLKAPGRSSASAGSSLQRRRESPASRRVSLASLDDTEMAATMNGVVPKRRRVDSARRKMAAAGLDENGTSARRIFSASQPYLGGDLASSYRKDSHIAL